jgi:hypothetical protein
MAAYHYDPSFIRYTARSSAYAARAVTSLIGSSLGIRSVLDVGCAAGTWLRAWNEQGVSDIRGVDGSYVDRALLEIPVSAFTRMDLNDDFDLGRRFDLVQSLEVAEHIEAVAAEVFVENLTKHASRFVLFSAAPPGQGGENHINEQSYDFWRTLFEKRGFAAFDCVRPAIAADKAVSYWYRYNSFLYVRREALNEIPTELRVYEVGAGRPLPDISPFVFRLRKALLRRLPSSFQSGIAWLKTRALPTGRL